MEKDRRDGEGEEGERRGRVGDRQRSSLAYCT